MSAGFWVEVAGFFTVASLVVVFLGIGGLS